jgi:hypothetical protein
VAQKSLNEIATRSKITHSNSIHIQYYYYYALDGSGTSSSHHHFPQIIFFLFILSLISLYADVRTSLGGKRRGCDMKKFFGKKIKKIIFENFDGIFSILRQLKINFKVLI